MLDLGQCRDALVQFDIGKHAAIDSEFFLSGLAHEILHQRDDGRFKHLLRCCRHIFAFVAGDGRAQKSLALAVGAFLPGEIRIKPVAIG